METSEVAEAHSSLIKTFNEELDRRIGGIPTPTLCLVEGPNDSGKSVFVQQLTYGSLRCNHRVCYVTTENTPKSLIMQMESLNLNVRKYYLSWKLRVVALHVENLEWNPTVSKTYLNVLKFLIEEIRNDCSVFIIDSITYLITHTTERDMLEFFTQARNIVDQQEKSIFITIHPFATTQEMLGRIRSLCDCHFELMIREVGDKFLRVMNVAKIRGAVKQVTGMIPFDVDPAFGIKVLPFSFARA